MNTHSPQGGDYQRELESAIAASNAGRAVIMRHYPEPLEVQQKDDFSPVTVADIAAEKAIRERLLADFPDYGFYGEETGEERKDAEFLWLVDPIDGTKSFIRQSPFFSTQIALMHRGELVVGVSQAPVYGELAYAARGQGAVLNAQPVQAAQTTDLSQAYLSVGNLGSLASNAGAWPILGQLIGRVARFRGYGDFCHYHQLSCGQADVVVESDVNILDIAALVVIVTEAGGKFTELDGSRVDLDTRTVLATATATLHQQVLDLFFDSLSA